MLRCEVHSFSESKGGRISAPHNIINTGRLVPSKVANYSFIIRLNNAGIIQRLYIKIQISDYSRYELIMIFLQ